MLTFTRPTLFVEIAFRDCARKSLRTTATSIRTIPITGRKGRTATAAAKPIIHAIAIIAASFYKTL